MDLQARLEAAVQHHNMLLNRESALEQERNRIHDQRIEAAGRVKALDEVLKDSLVERSLAASENGSGENYEGIPAIVEEASQNDE